MTSTHHIRCIFPEDACTSASRPHRTWASLDTSASASEASTAERRQHRQHTSIE